MITSENYVINAITTDCAYTEELHERMVSCSRLMHSAMGMNTEAGEFIDALKKHVFYGKVLDKVNLKEEIGDLLWYCAIACSELGISLDEVMTQNIDKLKLRYPNKFNSEDAINRNVEAERVLLEGTKIDKIESNIREGSIAGFYESNPDKSKDWIKDRFETDKQHNKFINNNTLFNMGVEGNISKRGEDWILFAIVVLDHIENYTVPQYGDKNEDQVTNWSLQERVNQITKYAFRQGKNAREGQDELDLVKIAHYAQLSHNKLKGDI